MAEQVYQGKRELIPSPQKLGVQRQASISGKTRIDPQQGRTGFEPIGKYIRENEN